METKVPELSEKGHAGQRPQLWRAWLPSRGSVLLVLLAVIGLLNYDRRAAAFPLGAPSAASTAVIPYQGRLADSSAIPLNGSFALTFKLYSQSSGGSPLWIENWSAGNSVQLQNGYFNVLLGSLTPLSPGLFGANDALWLGVTVGGDAEMTPRVQLGSAPFALGLPVGAVNSSNLDAIDAYSYVDPLEVTTSTVDVSLATIDQVTITLEQSQWVNIFYGATAAVSLGQPAYMSLSINGGPAINDTLTETWNTAATTMSSVYGVQLPAGTHTITAKYRTQSGGTASFWRRKIHAFVISQ